MNKYYTCNGYEILTYKRGQTWYSTIQGGCGDGAVAGRTKRETIEKYRRRWNRKKFGENFWMIQEVRKMLKRSQHD